MPQNTASHRQLIPKIGVFKSPGGGLAMNINEETIEATMDSNGQLQLTHQSRLPLGKKRCQDRMALFSVLIVRTGSGSIFLSLESPAITRTSWRGERRSVMRVAPFGDELWQERMATALGVQSSFRPRGRSKKTTRASANNLTCPEWHQIKLQVLALSVLAAARRGTFS